MNIRGLAPAIGKREHSGRITKTRGIQRKNHILELAFRHLWRIVSANKLSYHLKKNHGNSRGAKSGFLSTLPENENKHTCSEKEIRPRAFRAIVFLQHDKENTM